MDLPTMQNSRRQYGTELIRALIQKLQQIQDSHLTFIFQTAPSHYPLLISAV